MIEPEEMRRYRRHLALMLRDAATDPAAFAQIVNLFDSTIREGLIEAADTLRTATEDAGRRVPGHSWSDIAAELGVHRSSAAERFGGTRRGLTMRPAMPPAVHEFLVNEATI